ncbi:TPA: hypothetical protein I9Y78_002490 [Elizabethkingia anophelis]|nr:hypothetical protein [Elizabethkingia anophelis]
MMRNLIYILVIFFSISCSEKQDQKQPKPVSRVLMPVADTKKMLKIEGGSYKPFVGKETDILVKVKTIIKRT